MISCFRPQWFRDGLNRQTDFQYNAAGQLTEQTDPADAYGVRRRTIIDYLTSAGGLSRREVVRVCANTGTLNVCDTSGEIRTEYDYWENTFLPSAERRIDASFCGAQTRIGLDGACDCVLQREGRRRLRMSRR